MGWALKDTLEDTITVSSKMGFMGYGQGLSIDQQPTLQLTSEQIEQLRLKAQGSLYFFTKFVLGYKDMVRHIHRPLCKLLEDESKKKLRIILPRGWFKTTLVSISYSLWVAIKNPDIHILIAQNTHTNAISKLRSIRDQVEKNELFRLLFPEILPDSSCTWTNESLQLRRKNVSPEGTFEAAGIRTQVTSRHYDIIIEDDTVAPDLDELGVESIAPTKENIDQAIGWHRLVPPLLVHPKHSRNIVVGTRWFEIDLLSWIEKNEPYFHSYVRSCRETSGLPDPKGELTFPERFDQETLDGLAASMGPYMFACLYLNTPTRSDDMLFRQEWFKYYETEPSDLITYTTVDLAGDPKFSKKNKKSGNDYNVVMTTGLDLTNGNIYVLDYWRKKTNPSEVINEIIKHYRLYKSIKVGVEAVAYQGTMLYYLDERKRKEGLYFSVEGITYGNRSKEFRIRGLQPLFASGKVYLRSWMSLLSTELLVFPYGAHDDLADCLAMQKELWSHTRAAIQRKTEERSDPLSLEAAEKELRGRFKKVSRASTMALLETVGAGVEGTYRRQNG